MNDNNIYVVCAFGMVLENVVVCIFLLNSILVNFQCIVAMNLVTFQNGILTIHKKLQELNLTAKYGLPHFLEP